MLESERLTLAPLRPGDERWLWPFMSDPLTMWAWGEPRTYRDLEDWIAWSREAEEQWGLGRHLLRRKDTGAVVGDCGFFWWEWEGRDLIDCGWIVDRRHWRRGYAGEAMRSLLPALFARGHATAWAKMAEDNVGSWRTAEALGFRRTGSFRYQSIRWGTMRLYRMDAPNPHPLAPSPGGRG